MARPKFDVRFSRAQSPVAAATVTARAPVLPDRDPPPAAVVPPLPPLTTERDKPCWPRNESDIDLPPEPPESPPPAEVEMPKGIGYLGVVQATCPGVRGPFDMDVLVTGPDAVVFGSAQLSTVQALRLCKLLLLAVRLCDARWAEVRP
ncbi:MAG: hypothetical protein F9K32_20445 [Desulfobulbaceae bacterium]|nr:MAG: hypothetical protein F9K32_20445 [Desulfobulbaceae bacterium]